MEKSTKALTQSPKTEIGVLHAYYEYFFKHFRIIFQQETRDVPQTRPAKGRNLANEPELYEKIHN